MSASTDNNDAEEPEYVLEQYVRSLLQALVSEEMFKLKIDEHSAQASKSDSTDETVANILDGFLDTVSHDVSSFDSMTLSDIVDQLKCRCKPVESTESRAEEQEAEYTDTEDDGTWNKIDDTDSSVLEELAHAQRSLHMIECKDVGEFAVDFVAGIVAEAERTYAEQYRYPGGTRGQRMLADSVEYVFKAGSMSSDEGEEAHSSYEIPTVTVAEFDPEAGRRLIRQCVKCWRVAKAWKFWIEYTAFRADVLNDFHEFEVKWSRPSNEYPVPQVTVSVRFTIKVSRACPATCPVRVGYCFEGSSVQFKMTDCIDHERHLSDILTCKRQFFSQRHF